MARSLACRRLGSLSVRADSFRPIADDLRREVLSFYASRGERLEGAAGLNTLETNSGFVERRAATLLRMHRRHSTYESLAGLDVIDLGCGFGSLAVLFASQGARVTGVDPNEDRLVVGSAVAAAHQLHASFSRGWLEELDVPEASYDLAVLNNALCYVVPRERRRQGLGNALQALRPGGWLLLRNPNGLHPLDQFIRVPGLPWLSPGAAARVARVLRRHRSEVRLLTPRAARRELESCGFEAVRAVRAESDRLGGGGRFARYQHLVARRPLQAESTDLLAG